MKPVASGLRKGWRRHSGNLAMACLLVALAFLSWRWQGGAMAWQSPGWPRWVCAMAVLATYLSGCVLLLSRSARRAQPSIASASEPVASQASAGWLVVYASQTGYARQLAAQTVDSLRAGGLQAVSVPINELDILRWAAARRVLFLVSTTGEGDAPDMAAGFVATLPGSDRRLDLMQYGLLALGDSDYKNYCAFGHALDGWLQRAGAVSLFDTIEVDNGDAGALRHWQYRLGQLSGCSDLPDWQVPEYTRCRLIERELANPGSAGDPCFHIALGPAGSDMPFWAAGDIAEIGPQNSPALIDAWLDRHAFDGDSRIVVDGRATTLRDHAARCALDHPQAGQDPQSVAEALTRLPHRDYSIASIPGDGRIELLLRQWRRTHGSLGLGTGWLTRHAETGEQVSVRIRPNTGFHVPRSNVPLLLIGNGTGIASLRALIRQRIVERRPRNWLVFGERNAACDFHYRDEILAWQANASIERLDLAFSRDQAQRIYVQHRLEAAAGLVRTWVDAGCEILVCGSLQGMAPGVDAVLRRILGDDRVQELTAAGRYRRDVY